ncbi:MAG: DUF47 family protein [Methanomicrobiales archaeon]|nr:DUF47 family protein [Methanomicrobiales archaeon]
MGIREWVIPQDKVFFDQFEQLSRVVMEAADALVDLVENFEDVKTKVKKIGGIEHEGDRITHEVYEQLNITFITPMEPQEISRLASALDDILNYIDGTAQKMFSYGITETDAHMRELAKLI